MIYSETMKMLIRLEGVPDKALEFMIRKGYYKTKNEAVRAAVLSLAKEYSVLSDKDFLAAMKLHDLEEKRKIGNLKPETLDKIIKKYNMSYR